MKVGIRSFLLTEGKFPFSMLTNDATFEFFNENIIGGEDCFYKQLYSLNECQIRQKDRNNRAMHINQCDFLLRRFELSYYRYPKEIFKGFYFNNGSLIGINTTKYNPALDLSTSLNIMKEFKLIISAQSILDYVKGVLKTIT